MLTGSLNTVSQQKTQIFISLQLSWYIVWQRHVKFYRSCRKILDDYANQIRSDSPKIKNKSQLILQINYLLLVLQVLKFILLIIMKKNQQTQLQIQLTDSRFSSQARSSTNNSAKSEDIAKKLEQTNDQASSTKQTQHVSGFDLQKPLLESQGQKKRTKSGKDKHTNRKFSWPIWKKLFQYSLKRKYHLLSGLILNLCFALSVSILPLKVGNVLDLITLSEAEDTSKNISNLKNGVLELGILTTLLAFFTFARFLSLQFLQQFLAMDMRTDFYSKFISNDMYFFEQHKSGELLSRLSSDVNQAKSAVSNNLTYMIRNIVIIISNIIILFTLSWKLTLLIMLLVPIYSIITRQYTKRSKVLVKEYQDVQAEISAMVSQKFSGIQLVKACSTEEHQITNYSNIIKKGYAINKKKIYLSGIFHSCSQFLPYLGIMIVLLYGGSMVIEGSSELTAGQLTSFILYCTSLAHSTSAVSNSYTNIINGTYAVQRVFEMLEYKPLVIENKGAKQIISGEIQFRDVVFKYPTSKTVVLKNISFLIQRGQYVAFVGESGSGKSTIVKLIQKFYQIQSGSILFGNFDQSELNAIHLRKQIGLVNQQATIFSGNVQDNITYGVQNPSLQQIEQSAKKSGCSEFLDNSKRFPKRFLSQVGQRGNNLSGGQKQRVAIARALMRKPKIIIFDQATSALDSNSERMVQSSIQNLANIQSADKPTIIVIAHRLSTIINADRIFVMKNGEIVEQGTHRYLKNLGGYYYDLIKKQLDTNPELNGDLNLSPPKKGQSSLIS